MNRLMRRAVLLSLVCLGSLSVANADVRVMDFWNWGSGASCYEIRSLRLEENGLVTINFKIRKDRYGNLECPKNRIYNVTTMPPAQIRGAKGVNGKTPAESFSIQVTPETLSIILDVNEKDRRRNATYDLSKAIGDLLTLMEAEESIPSWQKAFQDTETQLAEAKASDKTPPSIQILSPTPNDAKRKDPLNIK